MSEMFLPPTGLIGAEQALTHGYNQGQGALQTGWRLANEAMRPVGPADMSGVNAAITQGVAASGAAIGQGVGALNPFAQPGAQAINLQAALAGALGAPAQAKAYADFQESPGQQYLREQSERALLRNSAAIGGLGGGNVRQELQRQAQGLAAQDFDRAFQRLGTVSQTGLSAAGQQAGLYGQQAGIAGNLYGQQAGIAGNLEGQRMGLQSAQNQTMAQLASTFGANASDNAMRAGESVATGRYDTGVRLADATSGTVSALSALANTGGQDIAKTIGTGAGSLAEVLAAAGAGQAGSQTSLAGLLAQILQSQGQQVAGLPGVPGVQNNPGIIGNIGNALQGAGAMMTASDARLKENIQHIGNASNGLSLYSWDWNDEGRRVTGELHGVGVLAQEVMETHPEAVAKGEDGWLRVNYGALFNG